MKRVLVAVKRVVDYNARIRVKADKVVCFRLANRALTAAAATPCFA